MKISNEMIHPALRRAAAVLQRFPGTYTVEKFQHLNRVTDATLKGHGFTKLADYRQLYVPRVDGSQLRLCVYTPKTPPLSDVPGLLWLHGGGYATGVPEQDFLFIERFVAAGCVVVAPDYVRSLEAPYPAALEDCYRALLWLRDNARVYGVRRDQLFVGGDSAGGGLTAALTLYARDRGEVSVAFQMPLYPMLDDRMVTISARDNDAPVWDSKSNELAWQLYLGGDYGTEAVSKYAAPARETDYRELPPTLTFVGSIEPFADETIQYTEELRAAGVEVQFRLFAQCFHAFDMLGGKTTLGQEAAEFMVQGFRHAAAHYYKPQPEQ